jgi:hypothetical protein
MPTFGGLTRMCSASRDSSKANKRSKSMITGETEKRSFSLPLLTQKTLPLQ